MNAKTATVTLNYPVQLADRLLMTVTIRRPVVGDILDHPINGDKDIAGEMQFLGALCGLPLEDMRGLDAEDYGRLQDQLLRFRRAAEQPAVPGASDGSVAADPVGA